MAGDTFGAIAEAFVRLRAKKDGSFEQDVRDQVLPSMQRLAGDAALLFAGKKLFDIGKQGLDELKQAEVVTAQTEVQLKATGGAAGVTAEHIDKLGQQMLNLAGFDDEAARSASNVLLRFKEIQGTAAFDRVEKDAADLAITLGTDLPSAARTLGLALQDPEKATRLLRSANVVLDASQKDALKSAVAQGDQAKVQEIILGSLEKQIGGAAKAFGDTLAGSQAKATESMKNAKAELVQGFAPAIQLGADITKKFADGISALPEPLRDVAGGVVFLGGTFASLARPAADVLRLLEGLRAARAASAAAAQAEAVAETEVALAEAGAATAAGGAAIATEGLAVAETALAAGSTAATAGLEAEAIAAATSSAAFGPLGLALGAAAALAVGLYFTLQDGVGKTVDAKTAIDAYTQALKENSDAAINSATVNQLAGQGSTKVGQDVAKSFNDAGLSLQVFFDEVRRGTGDLGKLQHNSQIAHLAVKTLGDGTTDMVGLREELGKAAQGGSAFAQALLAAREAGRLSDIQLVAIIQNANTLSGALGDARTQQDLFKGATQGAAGAVLDFNDASAGTPAVVDAAKAAIDAQKTAIGEMNTKLDETKAKFDAVAVAAHALLPASQRVQTGALDIADAQQHVIDAEQKLKDLRAGSPADLQKITDAQLAQAQAQKDYNDAVAKGDPLKAAEAQNRLAKATEAEVAARGKGADPEKVAQGERDVARSRLAVVTAVQNQATAIAELHVQQDAANGIVDSAVDKERFYHDALVGLDAQLTGPTHEAIAAHIADLDKVKTKTQEIIDKAQAVAKIDWTGMFRGMTGTARDLGLYAAAAREGQLGVASAPALGFDPAALNLSFVRTSELLADVKTKTNDLTAAFAANGATLDANTEAGRANQVAVQATGEAVAKLIVQKYQETGSLQEAQRAGNGYVENLRVQLRQAGLTETQVQNLIETMHLTPKDIATRFATNAIDTQTIVDTLRAHINDVPKDKQTAFQALIDQGSYDQANALLDQLAHDRQVRYDISKIGVDPGSFYVDANGNLQARAAGGYGTAGWVLRGEKGPELTYENMPSYTLPADVTAALSGGGSSGPTYNVNVTNYGSPPELAQSMVREVQRMGFLQTGTTKLARR